MKKHKSQIQLETKHHMVALKLGENSKGVRYLISAWHKKNKVEFTLGNFYFLHTAQKEMKKQYQYIKDEETRETQNEDVVLYKLML